MTAENKDYGDEDAIHEDWLDDALTAEQIAQKHGLASKNVVIGLARRRGWGARGDRAYRTFDQRIDALHATLKAALYANRRKDGHTIRVPMPRL